MLSSQRVSKCSTRAPRAYTLNPRLSKDCVFKLTDIPNGVDTVKVNEETFKPTDAMASAAKRALEIRDKQPDSNKGMTSVGLTRARQLIAKEPLSLSTVKRMYSFFSRHEVDKKGEGWGKDSKGYQAWLGWGGNAGYNWSRQIVERQKAKAMNINQIMINSTITKGQIVDNGSHWIIQGIPVTVDNAVMNGITYPADENAKGLPTINQRPITGGHPVRDGYPISVNEDMTEWYIAGNVAKHYSKDGIHYVDVKANKEMMKHSQNKLGKYFYDKLERKESFGVSTGLNLQPVQNANGEVMATNQQYDHLAFLHDDERPAGGDSTMVRFNSDGSEIMVINLDDMKKSAREREIEREEEELDEEEDRPEDEREAKELKKLAKLLKGNKFAQFINALFGDKQEAGYNNDEQINNSEGEPSMEKIDELLQAVNALQETVTKQGEQLGVVVQANADMKADMDKAKSEKEEADKKAKEEEDAKKKAMANAAGVPEEEAVNLSINTLQDLANNRAPLSGMSYGQVQNNSSNGKADRTLPNY